MRLVHTLFQLNNVYELTLNLSKNKPWQSTAKAYFGGRGDPELPKKKPNRTEVRLGSYLSL